jgi:hypothetical protein
VLAWLGHILLGRTVRQGRPPNLSVAVGGRSVPEEYVVSSTMIEDEVCLPPEEEDECLTPDVLLHIAYEVVSQLDNVADFR